MLALNSNSKKVSSTVEAHCILFAVRSGSTCSQEGKIPKLNEILEDSDEEPEPDAVVEVPLKKVKLVVGPGGERIRLIEKKSKARLQVRKHSKD